MTQQSGAGHLDRQEIIIVRRRAETEEGHHGGVWKIAFADFMTAMMAFFLVMWLTNASDDATRRQVAQYFNPIKLNDTSPATRGVRSNNEGSPEAGEGHEQGSSKGQEQGSGMSLDGSRAGGEGEAIFSDPYAVLAEIAAEGGSDANDARENGAPDGSGLPGLNGGEAYRDPFDPTSWQLTPNAEQSGGKIENAPPAEFKTTVERSTGEGEAGPKAGADQKSKAVREEVEPDKGSGQDQAAGDEALNLKREIEAELREARATTPSTLEVSAGDEGITVSLSDEAASGMFEVGSAKPTAEAIRMMESIAAVLSSRKGTIVIRGHTDARPYRSGEYDNWRLSTARAHMAYYMLARGGFDEARVRAIEGLADRQPKDPAHPEAPINRRIEILLTEKGQ